MQVTIGGSGWATRRGEIPTKIPHEPWYVIPGVHNPTEETFCTSMFAFLTNVC
jgi:hypothetical protein